MLSNTSIRDSDQVVSRRAIKESRRVTYGESKRYKSHNILMVDQLWIWYIKRRNSSEPNTVITSFPSREGVKVEKSRDMDDLHAEVLKNQDHHSREVISSTTDLVARIMNVCCRTLDRHQHVKTVQFVQMFQSTIGDAVSLPRVEIESHWESSEMLVTLLKFYRRQKRLNCWENFGASRKNSITFMKSIQSTKSYAGTSSKIY